LEFILAKTGKFWKELQGKRLFLSGGTGFFGAWFLESFSFANEELNLDASLVVLTRNVDAIKQRLPHALGFKHVHFHQGDIRSFDFPEQPFSHVIHAATASGTEYLTLNSLETLSTIADGTRRVLDFAKTCSVEKFLYVSSGAVYGTQPSELSHIPESYMGSPDPLNLKSTYGEGKRFAEHLSLLYGEQYGFEVKIARPFALAGPYLPLNAHFAIGNFLKNILEEHPIEISGDGTPLRSYLYAADLAVWMWTILFEGKAGRAYNVGSEEAISIADLANLMASGRQKGAKLPVHIAKPPIPGALPVRYVPSTSRAQSELNLKQTYSLTQSIGQMVDWYQTHYPRV